MSILRVVDGHRIGRLHRLLRHRAGLTQEALAGKCGLGRWKIVQLEAGELAGLRFGEVERSFSALDGRLEVRGWYHGAAADRLLDEGHARLVGLVLAVLRTCGWTAQVEVTFSEYGDRGSIDVLAWHAAQRALLVVEVKSEMAAIEGTLRPLDVKARLAARIARQRFGWDAAGVSRVLVLPEERTARRAVERHAVAINAVLPYRSRAVTTSLRRPVGALSGVWFVSDVGSANVKRNPSAIRRVRMARPRSDGRG